LEFYFARTVPQSALNTLARSMPQAGENLRGHWYGRSFAEHAAGTYRLTIAAPQQQPAGKYAFLAIHW